MAAPCVRNAFIKLKFPIWKLFPIFALLNHQELRIITYGTLREFGMKDPQVITSINAWYKVAGSKSINWQKPQNVVKTFGQSRVDILQNDRVCINLAGNQVRLVIKVEYGHRLVFVRWIGWHKDYEALKNNIHTI